MTDSGIEKMRLHSHQEFQTWLANDLEVRTELEAMIGVELGIDAPSLDTLEAFLLTRYDNPDAALQLGERGVLDAVARHIGLVIVLSIDGVSWTIDIDDQDNVYYRLPIIHLPDDAEECPLAMAIAAIERRAGDYLRSVVEAYIEDYNSTTDE